MNHRQLSLVLSIAAIVSVAPFAKQPISDLVSGSTPSTLVQGQRGGGPAGPTPTVMIDPFRFRYMGPAPAGRIASVVGIPGDPTTYYLGSASGGIWKSTDGAQTFAPIFDDQAVAAIGALAIAPSDPAQVWAGTGESWLIRYSDVMGDGVYKSSDAGATWKHLGLVETGRIARIVVHPTNPNIVFVCAVGRGTGPQQERGVFRTSDGGANWERVLFVNPDTGCSGLSMDASDPNTLIAGTWQMVQHTWGEFSGSWPGYTGTPGSGVYMSHDGGSKWTKVETGLPRPPYGKVDVAIAPSNSKRVYALIQTPDQGSLWRSDDGGVSFKVVSWDRSLIGRAGYYIRIAVNPQNADEVWVSSSSFHRSYDAGATFGGRAAAPPPSATPAPGGAGAAGGAGGGGFGRGGGGLASCGDCHDIWIDPKNPARHALTDDGGAAIATGQGQVINVSLPNGQMYHVATDNRVPYWIYSNRQDDGTMRGPSTVPEQTGNGRLPGVPVATAQQGVGGGRGAGGGFGGRGGGVTLQWEPNIGGCESGFTIPDPVDPNIVLATCYGNKVTRYDARTRTPHSVEPWMISLDSAPNEAKYRCHWTAPLAIDPFDHNTVYYGCQLILKTSNEGHSWTEFSPDLSTKDPSRIISNGGLVGDNLGQYDGEVIWAIAPSKIQRGLIWAGTNDGKLWYTKEAASSEKPTWVDVTKNIPGIPAWGAFAQIAPSSFDPATAYVAIDFHLMDNRKPFVFKTTDFGATWRNVTGDLPANHPLDYVLSLAENPNKKGMLFAGTGHGFYYSMNDGDHWTQFKEGLPPAPVSWIEVQKTFHDVVISTYGRGLFILPNISILEQSGQTAPPPATQVFAPRPVIRMARSVFQQPGQAPFLFTIGTAPTGPIKMEILDASGKIIKTEQLIGRQGLNGASWNLQYEPPTLVALKTTPAENPHIWEEPRFQNTDTRRITHWGITPTTGVPIAAPGKYQVRFTIEGTPYTQPFEVVKDPAIRASEAELVDSTQVQIRIRDDITATSEMVNRMEMTRKQIEDLLKSNRGKDELEKPLRDLDKQVMDVELRLVTRSEMLSDDKYFPEAYKIYMNLIWLSGGVGQGASDEAGGVDYKPTDTQIKVLEVLERDLTTAKTAFATLTNTTIPGFNKTMAGKLPEIK